MKRGKLIWFSLIVFLFNPLFSIQSLGQCDAIIVSIYLRNWKERPKTAVNAENFHDYCKYQFTYTSYALSEKFDSVKEVTSYIETSPIVRNYSYSPLIARVELSCGTVDADSFYIDSEGKILYLGKVYEFDKFLISELLHYFSKDLVPESIVISD